MPAPHTYNPVIHIDGVPPAAQYTGIPWAKYVVALGALAGILTGPLVGFYAGARIFCILGRDRLLPPLFARMNTRFGTPAVATAVQGIAVCKSPPFPPSSCFKHVPDGSTTGCHCCSCA